MVGEHEKAADEYRKLGWHEKALAMYLYGNRYNKFARYLSEYGFYLPSPLVRYAHNIKTNQRPAMALISAQPDVSNIHDCASAC